MDPSGRNDGHDRPFRLQSRPAVVAQVPDPDPHETDVVFDFSGLARPQFRDLALVITARMRAAPGDRVWARALPLDVWHVLMGLGLDHLFRVYPGPPSEQS